MSWRVRRTGALTAVAGALALVVSVGGATASSATHQRLVDRCVAASLGIGGGAARAVPGSADPQVAAELSIFRAARTSEDELPRADDLARMLKQDWATSYDPSASLRLSLGDSPGETVYAVPATLAAPRVPARCAHVSGLAGLHALLALRAEEFGTGPGVCLVSVTVEPTGPPISVLPGKRRRRPTGTSTTASAGCESLSTIGTYLGTFGSGFDDAGLNVALIPDGVSSLTYTFADGRQISVPVTGNVASIASTKQAHPLPLGKATRTRLTTLLSALTPVGVTETDSAGGVVATFSRPPSLVGELVTAALQLRRSVDSGSVGSENAFAACSARTHRCVVAVVSTQCIVRTHRCTISRRIERYRYVGTSPPRGTTGKRNVPTGPIRARVSGYFTHPGKLSLSLSGAPRHRVDVLVSATCFSRRGSGGASGVGRQPLQLAVPSRTTIATVRRHRECDVNVLVISSQPGAIRARLTRS